MVRSYAKPVEFTLGAQTWLLDDQHCVRANCSCQEAALSFFELRPSTQHSGVGNRADPLHSVRVRYWTNRIAFRGKGWTVVPAGFRRCAKRSPTGFRSRLAKRQALLRRLYRRALSRKTIRLQAPKLGRNERCPCASGKKYKKCCGA